MIQSKHNNRFSCFALAALLSAAAPFAYAKDATIPLLEAAIHNPNAGRGGIVVAEEELAAKIGADILAMGGNAVDAAVATCFALAVTYPSAGNIGGGGFMLVYDAEIKKTVAIDYRERAPAGASRDMYLNADGLVDEDAILYSHKSAGVPGTVAGLLHAHELYGKLSRKEVMAPAIALAEDGYPISYYAAASLVEYSDVLKRDPGATAEFFRKSGDAYLPGETFKRPDLGKALKKISREGRDGFYKGSVAKKMATAMSANGGLVTENDLASYEVVAREPVTGKFRGYDIVSMPPPSSGGVLLIQMLDMLETQAPFSDAGDSAPRLHFISEIMRRAYADRAEHMGDPDFADVPVEGLISEDYTAARVATISSSSASKSSEVLEGDPYAHESPDTTHISVIDSDGNMVANTYTLNLSYGSGIVVPGTGILLNNEMDDFSASPGIPNSYGLVGGEKNAIEAGKRPLSSMTPALLFKDGEPFMATGAPGGARIITAVFNIIVNVIDRSMNIADATDAPRIHHQWLPDEILYEPGMGVETKAALEAMGHELRPFNWYARPATAVIEDGWTYGYADPRTPGGAACSPDGGC